MKISVIHATLGRPDQAAATCFKWLSRADAHIEYIVSLNAEDNCSYSAIAAELSNYNGGFMAYSKDSTTAISAFNHGFKQATGDILIAISDDTDCPEFWDTLLLKELKGRTDFCAKVDDGLQPTLITMPIMDRVYYERYGYCYHPEFAHMHCDEELTCVALMTGKYIKIPLTFLHNHYSTGRNIKDAVNIKNDLTWSQGQKTLDRHAKNNFGIENPVMRREDIVWR